MVKNSPAIQEMQEIQVGSLGQEDPVEEEMTTHSSVLAWKIPRREKTDGLKFMILQKVRHNWTTRHTPTYPQYEKVKIGH